MICEECGFVYDDVPVRSVPARLVEGARTLTAAPHGDVTARPAPGVWSQLEYLCHVRDVLQGQRDRVALILREHRPELSPMGRDERAVAERYNEQDPTEVAAAVRANASALADYLEALSDEDLERTAIYGYPTRQERTIAWIGVHTVHELVHHALDISRQ